MNMILAGQCCTSCYKCYCLCLNSLHDSGKHWVKAARTLIFSVVWACHGKQFQPLGAVHQGCSLLAMGYWAKDIC